MILNSQRNTNSQYMRKNPKIVIPGEGPVYNNLDDLSPEI